MSARTARRVDVKRGVITAFRKVMWRNMTQRKGKQGNVIPCEAT